MNSPRFLLHVFMLACPVSWCFHVLPCPRRIQVRMQEDVWLFGDWHEVSRWAKRTVSRGCTEAEEQGWGDVAEAPGISSERHSETAFPDAEQELQDSRLPEKNIGRLQICSAVLMKLDWRGVPTPTCFPSISHFQLGKYPDDIQFKYFGLYGPFGPLLPVLTPHSQGRMLFEEELTIW